MVRTQIQLTERQSRRLKALAKREGISVAELIRRAVDRASDAALAADEEEVRARALTVIGKYADSATDVSKHHDWHFRILSRMNVFVDTSALRRTLQTDMNPRRRRAEGVSQDRRVKLFLELRGGRCLAP
jgi:hypothetical protein